MINESGELVTPTNPVEPEPLTPSVEPAVTAVPTPEVNPFEAQNKQLFARATRAEDEAKELKAKISELTSQQVPSETVGFDYEDDTKEKVKALEEQFNAIQEKAELDALYAQYPPIKDKASEFDEYRKDYPRHKLGNVAKLFLAENDLLETTPRVGLESPTGGARVAPTNGKMTAEDVSRLRRTNYNAYRQMLKEGKLNISD